MTQDLGGATPYIFVVIAKRGFDLNALCAASPIRLGYMRGFAQIGIPACLVYTSEVERVLPRLSHRPFVFLSGYEYMEMTDEGRAALRDYPHFVWINEDYEAINSQTLNIDDFTKYETEDCLEEYIKNIGEILLVLKDSLDNLGIYDMLRDNIDSVLSNEISDNTIENLTILRENIDMLEDGNLDYDEAFLKAVFIY